VPLEWSDIYFTSCFKIDEFVLEAIKSQNTHERGDVLQFAFLTHKGLKSKQTSLTPRRRQRLACCYFKPMDV
jgi:hypothetical protein